VTDATEVSEVPTDDEPENTMADGVHSSEPATSDDTGARTGKGRALPIVLAGLCVLAAVLVGLLSWLAITAKHAQRDLDTALDAARTRAPLVLSYAPATIDADIAKAREQVSGAFAAQFDQLVNSVVLPATKQQGLASKVDVVHSALVEPVPDPLDHADVLLMVHQVVTGNNQQPQEGTVQVRVTMTRTADGRWLISGLQPI